MNTQPPVSYTFARGSIMYFSWVAFIAGAILLFCTLFNIPPYIDFGDGLVIGFSDYKYGVPVEGEVNSEIPETSIARFDGNARSVTNIYRDSTLHQLATQPITGIANDSDTIRVQYANLVKSSRSDMSIPAARIDSMTFFLQPSNFFQKFILTLPFIMLLFIIGFCCRQIAKMLDTIHEGKSFIDQNYIRIKNIAWLIIGYQLLMFVIGLIQDFVFGVLIADFVSSIPNYRAPVELSAYVENDFNMVWLVCGCMLLVIARTFKAGRELEKVTALTI